MKPGVHDFTIYQGSKLSKSFVWAQGSAPPVPVVLTGYTARAQVRSSIDSSEVLVDATTENGKLAIVAAEGRITLTLTAAQTAALSFTTAVYDIELIPPTGANDAFRFVQGKITLDKEVTRA